MEKTHRDIIQTIKPWIPPRKYEHQRHTDSALVTTAQNIIDASNNTDKHDKHITEISSKLSDYEDRLDKLIIKNTYIQLLSL